MEINFIKDFILNERKDPENKLFRTKLTYALHDLDPVISEDTMNYHYGKLYKAYVDKYNTGEGDPDFNEAGAFLHRLYFEQFKTPQRKNEPFEESGEFLKEHFAGNGLEELKSVFETEAMKLQGSGWIYLAKNGQIKTIRNHAIRSDIVLLIDLWEHGYFVDYGPDKKAYLKNIWKIIDWNVINRRLQK